MTTTQQITAVLERQVRIEKLLNKLVSKIESMEGASNNRWRAFQQIITENNHRHRRTA